MRLAEGPGDAAPVPAGPDEGDARPGPRGSPPHRHFSKLGGEPDLPQGAAWPYIGGRPLAFLVQLDLVEVRAAGGPGWLPETGRLWAFNDKEGYGGRDHLRVLFASTDPPIARRPFPVELQKRHRYGERPVDFHRMTSIPSLDWLGVDVEEIDVVGRDLDELADAPGADFGNEPQHRIGGYPAEIQDERMAITAELLARGLDRAAEITPAIERAAREWRLLLQIDSDPALGMNFGDAGRLYVFIKEKHARAGDFSKTVSNWQTY